MKPVLLNARNLELVRILKELIMPLVLPMEAIVLLMVSIALKKVFVLPIIPKLLVTMVEQMESAYLLLIFAD